MKVMSAVPFQIFHAAGSASIVLEYDKIRYAVDASELQALIRALCDPSGGFVGVTNAVIMHSQSPGTVECRHFQGDGTPAYPRLGNLLCVARASMQRQTRTDIAFGGGGPNCRANQIRQDTSGIWYIKLSDITCAIPNADVVSSPRVRAAAQVLIHYGVVSLVDCGGPTFIVMMDKSDLRKSSELNKLAIDATKLTSGAIGVVFASYDDQGGCHALYANPISHDLGSSSISAALCAVVAGITAKKLNTKLPTTVTMPKGAVDISVNSSSVPWIASVSTPVVWTLTGTTDWNGKGLGTVVSGEAGIDEVIEYDKIFGQPSAQPASRSEL